MIICIAALFAFVPWGCEKGQLDPGAANGDDLDWRGKNCFNFRSNFDGCLNFVTFDVGGVTYQGFGATPAPGQVGDYQGYWASIILETVQSGNGATHYSLIHKFQDEDGDYFYTDDRAVCSPATGTGITCLINDQMSIVGGTGKFANASGKIKTHGPLTIGDPVCPNDAGSLSLELHGHVCLN